jgi:hypothetical protein
VVLKSASQLGGHDRLEGGKWISSTFYLTETTLPFSDGIAGYETEV